MREVIGVSNIGVLSDVMSYRTQFVGNNDQTDANGLVVHGKSSLKKLAGNGVSSEILLSYASATIAEQEAAFEIYRRVPHENMPIFDTNFAGTLCNFLTTRVLSFITTDHDAWVQQRSNASKKRPGAATMMAMRAAYRRVYNPTGKIQKLKGKRALNKEEVDQLWDMCMADADLQQQRREFMEFNSDLFVEGHLSFQYITAVLERLVGSVCRNDQPVLNDTQIVVRGGSAPDTPTDVRFLGVEPSTDLDLGLFSSDVFGDLDFNPATPSRTLAVAPAEPAQPMPGTPMRTPIALVNDEQAANFANALLSSVQKIERTLGGIQQQGLETHSAVETNSAALGRIEVGVGKNTKALGVLSTQISHVQSDVDTIREDADAALEREAERQAAELAAVVADRKARKKETELRKLELEQLLAAVNHAEASTIAAVKESTEEITAHATTNGQEVAQAQLDEQEQRDAVACKRTDEKLDAKLEKVVGQIGKQIEGEGDKVVAAVDAKVDEIPAGMAPPLARIETHVEEANRAAAGRASQAAPVVGVAVGPRPGRGRRLDAVDAHVERVAAGKPKPSPRRAPLRAKENAAPNAAPARTTRSGRRN